MTDFRAFAPFTTASLNAWRLGAELTTLAVEAQSVMFFRIMGLSGLWSVAPGENNRMVSEKPTAFLEASLAASRALATGQGPEKAMSAAIKPLRRKTRSNAKRLAKRGPKLPLG